MNQPNGAAEFAKAVHVLASDAIRIAKAQERETMFREVLCWLGFWRDRIPPEAVEALQKICGVDHQEPSKP